MSNKMSIDEMVRQKIAQGEEPHNLGAWANMERMLDGKNPYQKEESKDHKPWLFLLLGLIALSTAVVGGYNYFNTPNNKTNKKVAIANSSSNDSKTEISATKAKENNSINEPNSASEQDYTLNNNTNANNVRSSSMLASTNSEQSTFDAIRKQNMTESIAVNKRLKSKNNITKTELKKATAGIKTTNHDISNPEKSLNNSSGLLASNVQNTSNKKTKELLDKMAKKNASSTVAKTTDIPPTIKENYLDTTQVTEVSQRIQKDEFGNKKIVADSFRYNIVEEKQRTVINPRYVELTKEQEKAAQRRTAIASNTPVMSKPKLADPTPTNTNVEATANASEVEAKTKKQNTFFSLFKRATASIKQKGINMAHTRTPIYTGLFLGVNAAQSNSKHNFGGFQGGFTAMTPLSRLFTLQMEARFVNQNNSGYTVTDNKNIIRSYFIDSTTLTHSRIYNYEVDSISYGYNLKDFYTLQVPLLLNANFNKWNVYGGLNFNYGFRMNISTSSSSSPLSIADTSSSASYMLRTDSKPNFARDDFSNRLGLGYTLGAGYNFTNRINLDLRMSNLLWDNTTGSKREISNVFFRIPNFQLSLGYRFRKFEIEE